MVTNKKSKEIAQRIYNEHYSIDMTDEEGVVKEIAQIIKSELK